MAITDASVFLFDNLKSGKLELVGSNWTQVDLFKEQLQETD